MPGTYYTVSQGAVNPNLPVLGRLLGPAGGRAADRRTAGAGAEAALARELDICYAALAVVVNPAAGRGASAKGVRMDDINTVSQIAVGKVHATLEQLVHGDGD